MIAPSKPEKTASAKGWDGQYVKLCVKVQGPVEPELELAWSAC